MRAAVAALTLGLGMSALAADPRVSVQADVVFASEKPGGVEPALEKMRATLDARKQYKTLKRLEGRKLELLFNRAQSFELPNKKTAVVRLLTLENDIATVTVKVPPTEATYKLAREKVLYIQAGAHDGGEVWLLLSQPR